MDASLGFLLAVVGGVLMGSFSLPMKRTAKWAWEATWLVWAVAALVIVPWVIALTTCSDLMTVYARSGTGTLAMIFLFGVGWGLGAVTFGQSISILGMSQAFAISIGLTLALGSLVPMASEPRVFLTCGGATVTGGIALMVVGVVVCAVAGARKEAQLRASAGRVQAGAESPGGVSAGAFVKGLTLCILSGIFNPMINFANNYADPLKDAAKGVGASAGGASDAIWAVALLGGFVTNAVYCAVLLIRNRTWVGYGVPGTVSHWLLAVLMGVTWVLSITLFGRAAAAMGELGNSAGWAITMGCCIAASNAWGILTGEWREGRGKPLRTMYIGLAVILLAIAVIGYGNSLAR
ncbi:MAG TPA: L-rhamnose/proton symporter RhaT [Phycisphaerae bacterium]|nr:L-rhamnose/proton symporter RhaT [Phycisphaerae bacterium]HRY68909.1 L-rhamnose/proton symporter RhaT [Phycisphaerae bacterium]HSA25736.1 L-rhamnose/proton symporter RhaT [Phycisphaerae bacterium]